MRIVATVAYIVPSFSFPVAMSNVAPLEAFSSMISSEFVHEWTLGGAEYVEAGM